MAIKKSELYRTLWSSCNELRGGMDAYEYLMRHFATKSGKCKGQFHTPAGVSHIIAQVIGIGQAKSIGYLSQESGRYSVTKVTELTYGGFHKGDN